MKIKRCVAVILSISILSSLLMIQGNVSASTTDTKTVVSEENYSDASYYQFLNIHEDDIKANESIKVDVSAKLSTESMISEVIVETDGLYTFGMSYKSGDSNFSDYEVSLKIDGEYQYESAKEFVFPRMWKDADKVRVDGNGNQFAPEQIQYEDYYLNFAYDTLSEADGRFLIWLSAGKHNIEIALADYVMDLEYIVFGNPDKVENYVEPNKSEYYTGAPIIIEGEKAELKSSHFLAAKADNSTTAVSPYDAEKSVVNYIGGGNWKKSGDTITWTTSEIPAGYYQLGFSFRQNAVIGGKTYRTLRIDGEIPFAEATAIGFEYSDTWQKNIFSDKNNKPYFIYLSEGSHQISLTVTSGDISAVSSKLSLAVTELGSLYLDINMITGETVDIYRDYELFKQIPDMDERLNRIKKALNDAADLLVEITGSSSGSQYSVIKNMVEVINQMNDNKFEAHRYKDYYYTNYCSVSSVFQELKNMPLELDKMVLASPDDNNIFKKTNFFENLGFSVKRFLFSFIEDYTSISDSGSSSNKSVTLWVNWGRDQAQVLSSLVERTFTAETGIPVNIQLVNASLVQATLSGKGPDVFLQHARSEPVNLAMRGLLYDLSDFDDCDEVITRFQNGATEPYRYKNGLYALPDTQTFFMMFARTDILKKLNIQIPETWDEFDEVAKLLARHNMNVWLQVNTVMDAATNGGVGSTNLFPSFLLQNGLSLYEEDGSKTTLTNPEVMKVFSDWSDYYSKMKFPKTMDMYNRFRTGTTPLAICSYTMYTTLKVAAPEIDGLWTMTAIPGTIREDGTLSRASSGGGTGCAIMKTAKNPESAWEFLKWWTDTETQMLYSNEVESILGAAGRVALSNVDALLGLDWDKGFVDSITSAWEEVREIPEYPGSYYLSRSIYQSFWKVVNNNENSKDMLLKYGKEADDEIARKWEQYTNRG